jgi:hypothetical protein
MQRHAHLVGSVGLKNRDEVFRVVSENLGPHLTRVPDGETGERNTWIAWQRATFASHPAFEPAQDTATLAGRRAHFFGLKAGVNAGTLELPELGYAREAVESYDAFASFIAQGKFAASTRFLVALP